MLKGPENEVQDQDIENGVGINEEELLERPVIIENEVLMLTFSIYTCKFVLSMYMKNVFFLNFIISIFFVKQNLFDLIIHFEHAVVMFIS